MTFSLNAEIMTKMGPSGTASAFDREICCGEVGAMGAGGVADTPVACDVCAFFRLPGVALGTS